MKKDKGVNSSTVEMSALAKIERDSRRKLAKERQRIERQSGMLQFNQVETPVFGVPEEFKALRITLDDIERMGVEELCAILSGTHKNYSHLHIHPDVRAIIEQRIRGLQNQKIMDLITKTAKPNWMTWVILVCTVIVAIWTIGAGLAEFLADDKEHTPAVDTPLHKPVESSNLAPLTSQKFQDQLATLSQTEKASNRQNSPDLASKERSSSLSTNSHHTDSSSLSSSCLDPQIHYFR